MKTYRLDQLRNFNAEQINEIQHPIDLDAQNYADEKKDELYFLKNSDFEQLKEYYTDTMEKYRLIYKAIVQAFKTETSAGETPLILDA